MVLDNPIMSGHQEKFATEPGDVTLELAEVFYYRQTVCRKTERCCYIDTPTAQGIC